MNEPITIIGIYVISFHAAMGSVFECYRSFGIGLLQHPRQEPGQPIADECGIRLVKLPLGFGADGVEDQGRFARARDTREHRDFSLRDSDIYVLQVILARSFNYDIIDVHRPTSDFYDLELFIPIKMINELYNA